MIAMDCRTNGGLLEGRYGHTQSFSSWLGGLKGTITMRGHADGKSFDGQFREDFSSDWLLWRGTKR
jgi:hypothetical protein